VTALFEMPLATETLPSDELLGITGCSRRGD